MGLNPGGVAEGGSKIVQLEGRDKPIDAIKLTSVNFLIVMLGQRYVASGCGHRPSLEIGRCSRPWFVLIDSFESSCAVVIASG